MLRRPFFWTSLVITSFLITTEFWSDAWGGYRWYLPVIAFLLALLAEYRKETGGRALEEERQKFTIGQFFAAEYDRISKADPSARINIMLTLPLLSKPRLLNWGRRALSFFERIGPWDTAPDRDMVIREKQGVAGMALAYELPAIGMRDSNRIVIGEMGKNPIEFPDIDINFDQAQRQKGTNVRIVFSYPIRELKRDGLSVAAAGKIIGVINVDSSMSWDEWTKLIDPRDFVHTRMAAMTTAVAFALA